MERGRSFIFCDEVLFAGDLRSANSLKALATTTQKGLETKNLPIVDCPLGVNLWLASNADDPVHIEEGDARYWVLQVNESRIADSDYFDDLVHEIEHGGREAFAHFLLNLNVAKFVPKRDVARDNAERREIILHSFNPYDARCWLWDCAVSEQILGMEITMTDGILGCVAWKGANISLENCRTPIAGGRRPSEHALRRG